MAAFGATDFIVANPDRENLVLEKENEEGLSGRDLALARFRNRIKIWCRRNNCRSWFYLLVNHLQRLQL